MVDFPIINFRKCVTSSEFSHLPSAQMHKHTNTWRVFACIWNWPRTSFLHISIEELYVCACSSICYRTIRICCCCCRSRRQLYFLAYVESHGKWKELSPINVCHICIKFCFGWWWWRAFQLSVLFYCVRMRNISGRLWNVNLYWYFSKKANKLKTFIHSSYLWWVVDFKRCL